MDASLEVAPSTKADGRSAAQPTAALFVKRRSSVEDPSAVIRRPSISYWQDAWMRLKTNRVALAAGLYIILLSLTALIVPELLPYSYDEQEIWNAHKPPTLGETALVVLESGHETYEPVYADVVPPDEDSHAIEPPATPEGLQVIGEALTTGVALQWEPVHEAEGYRIYRSINTDSLGVPLEDLQANQVSYLDRSQLASETEYHYFVTAFTAMGESEPAGPVTVEPKLALRLEDARKIDPTIGPGATVQTNPHYLGTDYLGRDLLARVLMGARISLFIGFGAPLLYVLIGVIYGSIAGYFGGLIDDILMRVTDVVATVPELLVVILLQVMMGSGVETLLVALVAVAWARSARQIRGEVLRVREMGYVQAAKILGTPFSKIVRRHLLPNVMGTILVILTLAVPQAIFTEAFLSFIGLGISPPMASWGTIAKDGAKAFLTYPHELLIPSVLICLTMLAFNLFGDGLRDALDPKLRGTR